MNPNAISASEFHCGQTVRSGADLLRRGNQLAGGLQALGLREGDVVAVMLRNVAQWADVMQAARISGIVYCPINWHFKGQEIAHLLADSQAKVLIVEEAFIDRVVPVVPAGVKLIVLDSLLSLPYSDYEEWLRVQPLYAGPDASPRGAMPYTSGTTGRPKGILRLPIHPDERERQALRMKSLVAKAFGVRPGCRALIAAPAYHSAPGVFLQNALQHAELTVLSERFDPQRFLADIERFRIDTAYLVPVMYVRLLRLPQEVKARHDLSSLRFVASTGSPCSVAVKKEMIDWFGPVIFESYGSSETGMVTVIDSGEALSRPGSVGRPIDGATIRILDDDGRPVATGGTGRIYIRQPAFPDFTYRGNDEARRAIEKDGHICVGDIGRVDEQGYLYICDRVSDMVISGGVNVYPAEIESYLLGHEDVADCAVFGVPDEEFGERLVAVVQPVEGRQIEQAQMAKWLAERIASFKVPRQFVVARLPRDDSGKIAKRVLRDQYRNPMTA